MNNPNLESNSNILLNLNHDGGLNPGTNSLLRTRTSDASDADGGGTQTPKKREGERVLFDNTNGSGSLPTMQSISQGMSSYLSSRS